MPRVEETALQLVIEGLLHLLGRQERERRRIRDGRIDVAVAVGAGVGAEPTIVNCGKRFRLTGGRVGTGLSAELQAVVDLTNRDRASYGLKPLAATPALNGAPHLPSSPQACHPRSEQPASDAGCSIFRDKLALARIARTPPLGYCRGHA